MNVPLEWLLSGPPFVRYRAQLDLLHQPESAADVIADRAAMLADSQVQGIVRGLADWPGQVIASHKSAGQPFHRLTFLADLGLRATDPGITPIIERIFASQTPEGLFGLPMDIGEAHGGSGTEQTAWALCDAPLILYALLKFGMGDDPRVRAVGEYLLRLGRTDTANGLLGWPCAVSPALGAWRGPGRKDDPCPFANLAVLKALSQWAAWRDSPEARAGAETLLALWADSQTRHPYIFYMGTDFRKLKAPFVWYDLLHVLDVLTGFPHLAGDPRLADMIALLAGKADAEGRFTPESVWQAWAGWEFGQKKAPSRWLTLLAQRVLLRGSGLGVAA